jgi:trimeric autotransporter adhesin
MIGSTGTANDDHIIRIGDLQHAAYVAGIWGNTLSSGASVIINSEGQLGVQPSSLRYKDDVRDMGAASEKLLQLRPVTFHYKESNPDGSKPLEFGLIAEEVAKIYPELVIRGKNDQPEGVEYNKLPAMLLNELQRQYRHAEQQDELIRRLEARISAIESQLSKSAEKVPCSASRELRLAFPLGTH